MDLGDYSPTTYNPNISSLLHGSCLTLSLIVLQGELEIFVKFGGDLIPNSPIVVDVAPPLDLSKITVDNLIGRKKQ